MGSAKAASVQVGVSDSGSAWANRAGAAGLAGMALGCGLAGAALFWAIATPLGPIGAPAAVGPAPRARADASVLQRFDPFAAARAARRAAPAANTATASIAGLSLKAVRVAASPNAGSAIIAAQGAPQKSFQVGEAISPGLRLVGVAADHVILESAEGRSVLAFPGRNIATPAAAASTAPPPIAAAVAPITAPRAPTTSAPGQAREIVPETILQEVRLSPRFIDGAVRGFRIEAAGASTPELAQAGLAVGDIIIAINGDPLQSINRFGEIADDLESDEVVDLRYERGGNVGSVLLRRKLSR